MVQLHLPLQLLANEVEESRVDDAVFFRRERATVHASIEPRIC
jgi:hypothetical protein